MYTVCMAEALVKFFVRVPPDLHAALVEWAREEDRSLNKLVVRLLRQAVNDRRGA